jgi:NADH-ubiquinone oxidoreductase chain 6
MTNSNLFIDFLALGSIISSILVITSKNPVISVVFLISLFVNASGYLILLGIGFIGISYLIVYVGAIAVLFLFVIMMMQIKIKDILETGSQYTKNLPLALGIGSLFVYEMYTILPFTLNNVKSISALLYPFTNFNYSLLSSYISSMNSVYLTINPIIADTNFITFLQIEAIGQSLYTFGSIWLIIISVVLLLGMVAPIFISLQKS